ncbi:MAG: VCBS repeat-containing protein, partial [Bacteroidota bacterium]
MHKRTKRFLVGLIILASFSCSDREADAIFTLLPSQQTGLDFINEVVDQDSMNIIQYLYFYNGGGVAIGDINQDGLEDLFFTANQKDNRLFLNKGDLKFKDITEQAGIRQEGNWSTGANIVDVNGDGWLDIYVCQVGAYKTLQGKNQLFINQGPTGNAANVQFEEQAAAYGLDFEGFSTQSAFFDYDLDGDLDLYLLNHSVHSTETYRDTSATRRYDSRAGDRLYRNDGTQFTEVTQETGIISGIAGYGLGVAVADLDRNGCPDLYISNDFHEDDFLYLNTCDGAFRQVSANSFGHISNFSMGNDIADLNNDLWPDIMTLDMKPESEFELKNAMGSDPYDIYRFKRSFGYHDQIPRNMLQLHQGLAPDGKPRFSEVGQQLGLAATDWSWSVLLADLDNDGWKDIHISNGIIRRPNNLDYLKYISSRQIQENATDLELAAQMPSGKVSNYIYKNIDGKAFNNTTTAWGIDRPSYSNGTAIADLDNDGDLEIIVNTINEEVLLFENQIASQNYLQLSLEGTANNPFGIGAKVQVFTGAIAQQQSLYPTRGRQLSES